MGNILMHKYKRIDFMNKLFLSIIRLLINAIPYTVAIILFGNIFRNNFSIITFLIIIVFTLISLKLRQYLDKKYI